MNLSATFWSTLIGVAFGFFLSEIRDHLRRKRDTNAVLSSIKAEMRCIVIQIKSRNLIDFYAMASEQSEDGHKLFHSSNTIGLPNPTLWRANCSSVGLLKPPVAELITEFYTTLESFNSYVQPSSQHFLETHGHRISMDIETFLHNSLTQIVEIGNKVCESSER